MKAEKNITFNVQSTVTRLDPTITSVEELERNLLWYQKISTEPLECSQEWELTKTLRRVETATKENKF